MSRQRYPLIYELVDAIEDRKSPSAYFRDFESEIEESPSKAQVWAAREAQFASMDHLSWEALRSEASPYLTAKDAIGRSWSQLIAILNQARAHNYLKRHGCLEIAFVPRSRKSGIETPDIKASLVEQEVLCEVKTLGISDDEVKARKEMLSRNIQWELPPQFLTKLSKTIEKAQSQLHSYRTSPQSECIAFLVMSFDDWLGEYKSTYYRQIDEYLSGRKPEECRVVIYNENTAFHSQISMANAEVVNEDA